MEEKRRSKRMDLDINVSLGIITDAPSGADLSPVSLFLKAFA